MGMATFCPALERIVQRDLNLTKIINDWERSGRCGLAQQRAINVCEGFLEVSPSPVSLFEALTRDTESMYNILQHRTNLNTGGQIGMSLLSLALLLPNIRTVIALEEKWRSERINHHFYQFLSQATGITVKIMQEKRS